MCGEIAVEEAVVLP